MWRSGFLIGQKKRDNSKISSCTKSDFHIRFAHYTKYAVSKQKLKKIPRFFSFSFFKVVHLTMRQLYVFCSTLRHLCVVCNYGILKRWTKECEKKSIFKKATGTFFRNNVLLCVLSKKFILGKLWNMLYFL